MPLINGIAYSWANLDVRIANKQLVGITKINYYEEQDMENIYGAGQYPVARGYGRIKATGSITLLREEIEELRRASTETHRLQDLAPFDIIVSYVPVGGTVIKTDVLRNVQFMDDGVEANEGDTSNSKELNLIISHIDHAINMK